MYDSEGLAFTGLGITLGGVYLDMVWIAVIALILTAIGFLLLRLSRPRIGRGQ